jgi:hypothetical protein
MQELGKTMQGFQQTMQRVEKALQVAGLLFQEPGRALQVT